MAEPPSPYKNIQDGLALAVSVNDSLVGIVGTGDHSEQPNDRIYFWDDNVAYSRSDFKMHKPVINLLMRRTRFIYIVVCETTVMITQVRVYSLNRPDCLGTFDTFPNPTGIATISYDKSAFVLAIPDIVQGRVLVHNFNTSETKTLGIHQSPISQLSLDYKGRLCASASQLGTVVRVFDCQEMVILHELRRGHSTARMTSLSFCPTLEYLCGTSDHCTLHVWDLKTTQDSYVGSFLKSFVPSMKFLPSVAKLRLIQSEQRTDRRCKMTGPLTLFYSATEISVACLDGMLHRVIFDPLACSLVLAGTANIMEENPPLRQSLHEPIA